MQNNLGMVYHVKIFLEHLKFTVIVFKQFRLLVTYCTKKENSTANYEIKLVFNQQLLR